MLPDWEVFEVTPEKPYRKAFASCKNTKADLVECLKESPCFKSGAKFEDCLYSPDIDWITPDCHRLRQAYSHCRKQLMNPMRRLRPTLYD